MNYLEDLNASSKKPMNLVLYEFAEHLLRMDKGHALLIGLDYEMVEVDIIL